MSGITIYRDILRVFEIGTLKCFLLSDIPNLLAFGTTLERDLA